MDAFTHFLCLIDIHHHNYCVGGCLGIFRKYYDFASYPTLKVTFYKIRFLFDRGILKVPPGLLYENVSFLLLCDLRICKANYSTIFVDAATMNKVLIVSLNSGLPLFARSFSAKSSNDSNMDDLQLSSLLFALNKISSVFEASAEHVKDDLRQFEQVINVL